MCTHTHTHIYIYKVFLRYFLTSLLPTNQKTTMYHFALSVLILKVLYCFTVCG